MPLTPNQLKNLRNDLQTLANIEYDEVMNELLDHYATLTEQKMDNGISFEEASKWAWMDLGSGDGLQTIQNDYERSVRQQIRQRHLSILTSYFSWPKAVMTLLAATLIYLATPLVPIKGMLILLYGLGLSPMLVIFYGFRKHMDQQTDSRKIVWTYLRKSGSITWNLVYIFGLNTLNLSTDSKSVIWLFQIHSTVGIVLCWFALLYSISFIELFKENFDVKIPNLFTR